MTSFNHIICILCENSSSCNLQKLYQPKQRHFDSKITHPICRYFILNKKIKKRMIQFQSSRSHQRWDWGSDCPCQLPHQLLGLIKNPQICYSAFPFLFFASLLHLHTLQFSLCLCVYLLFFQSRPPDGLFLALYCIVVTCQLLGDMCCILISLRRRLRKWEAPFVMWLSSSIFLYLMEDMIWKKDPLQPFTFAIPIRRGSHVFISTANPNRM